VIILSPAARSITQTAALQSEIRKLRQEHDSLSKKAQQVKSSLTPEQYTALRAAHQLVDRKEFSWSKLFVDLETALPGSVRVTRISVRDIAATSNRTVAELELAVVAKSSTTITDMIAEMDRSGIFQAELRSQDLQTGRGETGTEYELSVIYRPRLSSAVGQTRSGAVATLNSETVLEEPK
jgi:Tfp pilus assembly protein PilN